MRVVSQNKNYSFDFDRTVFWTQYNVIYAKIGNESIAIGQYKSEERAAEVFNDIHNLYCPYKIDFKKIYSEHIGPNVGLLNMNIFMIPQIEQSDIDYKSICDSVVFYMPEE